MLQSSGPHRWKALLLERAINFRDTQAEHFDGWHVSSATATSFTLQEGAGLGRGEASSTRVCVGRACATDENDGRAFLKWVAYSRCGFAGTFTDFLDNGIVSTMADSSTAQNAKQTFSNAVC